MDRLGHVSTDGRSREAVVPRTHLRAIRGPVAGVPCAGIVRASMYVRFVSYRRGDAQLRFLNGCYPGRISFSGAVLGAVSPGTFRDLARLA